MIYECAMLQDKLTEAEWAGDKSKVKKVDDRMGFLTPILKGFLTEAGVEAASLGVQVYGGHGYIKSNKQEQNLRDVRIAPVWEGTTGIQALDLLARKVMLQKLKPIHAHLGELYGYAFDVLKVGGGTDIRRHAATLLMHLAEWQYITYRLAAKATVGKDRDALGVASVPFLMYAGYVQMAYHWLRMEVAAERALLSPESALHEPGFYKSKIQTADFYFENLLPSTRSLKAKMFAPTSSLMAMKPEGFSYDHSL